MDPAPRLYELVLENGRSASPFVWRVRYALAHKGLAFESVPLGLTDIPTVLGGRFRTVPILEHGTTAMAESWDIVQYLDRAFPQRPLFSGPAELQMVRLVDTWLLLEVGRRLLPLYLLDVHDAARPEDREYFRRSREAYFGGTSLEALAAGRAAQLPAVRAALEPLRLQLAQAPFLGGTAPNFADYVVLGLFQWIGSVCTLPPLAGDDAVLRGWLERGFALYDGIGQDNRLRPLFE
ncbi:MAG: glutathione S-transferase N-terminal domain-containing protein [Proteobacteria bacterium]|nr:glutathione S-transferase N-terminal domain-containing protein [Pseudomonadota bacterium]